MASISDINTAGASSNVIKSYGGDMQILINGTWNGGQVDLQKYVPDEDSWLIVNSYTANDYSIIETIGSGQYRTFTTHGGSAPSLVCDVTFDGRGGEVV